MRRILIVLPFLAVVMLAGSALGPAGASGAPGSRRGSLTIASRPNPITVGDAVLVSGRLSGPGRSRARVVLWHRLGGWRRFHPAATARTDAAGRYEILLRPGVVTTNRRWYLIGRRRRSRTVLERVYAAVTLTPSAAAVAPGEAVTLRGHVAPTHRGQRILLRQRFGTRWVTIAQPRLDRSSSFRLSHTFTTNRTASLRAVLPGDPRNLRSRSSVHAIDVNVIHRIKHVVIIMQENRSFDQYFGTYPGADGIPAGVCVPDPRNGGCVRPFHDPADKNFGGPHSQSNATADIAGGQMNGFVGQAEKGTGCTSNNPNCSPCASSTQSRCIDVMGYHDAREIPNYWTYAHDFVLQDRMFEPNASWSLPEHLFQVSEWSALCTNPFEAISCTNALQSPNPPGSPLSQTPLYAWTDMTYLLHRAGVSWGTTCSRAPSRIARTTAPWRAPRSHRDPRPPGSGIRFLTSPTSSRTASWAMSRRWATSSRRPRRGHCPPSPGSTPTGRSQSTRRRSSAPARPT